MRNKALCSHCTPMMTEPSLLIKYESSQSETLIIFYKIVIVIYLLALPFGVTTETLATQDPDREDEETDTPIFEKHDAMLHGQRKDRK